MLLKDDAARLFDYTAWANQRSLHAAATLSADDFKRDLKSSHGGVRGTLAHVMGAEWIWLERWKGVSPARLIDESEFPDAVSLRDRWAVIEAHRQSWLRSLSDEDLGRPVAYRNMAGREFAAPLWQLVKHVVNHSTYHRGQVATLLRQLGATPVSTDLVFWDRDRELHEGKREPRGRPP